MAESYFELLTEQQGLPTIPFDPLVELKRLRRMLELRMQQHAPTPEVLDVLPFPSESVSMDAVLQKVEQMKKALAVVYRSRHLKRLPRGGIYRIPRQEWKKRSATLRAVQCGEVPQAETLPEGVLDTLNAGLMALGVIGVIFGVLSFLRGMESDLSLGSLVCASGAAIVSIGLGGRLLASR